MRQVLVVSLLVLGCTTATAPPPARHSRLVPLQAMTSDVDG